MPARHERLLLPLLLALALAGPTTAWALASDRDQPIEIEADWAEADDARGITVYKGRVRIDQGSLRITGDVVTLYYDANHELKRMVAVGRLARFRQRVDGEEELWQRAKATRIQYDLTTDTMVLTGNAELAKGGDIIRADRIVYDTLNARIMGESVPVIAGKSGKSASPGKSRVRITITPKKQCPDGTRRTRCKP